MYEAYYRLTKRPFAATPDAGCFYASEAIQEIHDQLLLRAETAQGIGLLTAPAGTGKTLLCRRLAIELRDDFTPIYLANANFPTRRALLQAILFELGQKYSGMEEQELRLELVSALKDLVRSGRPAVLIIDEAHLLNDRLLEEVRTLASVSEEDAPLLRVILSGQLELEEKLIDPALEALNQRVACHVYLEPLTRRESIDYIIFRIEWAGGQVADLFTDEALDRIAQASNGLPRCLNQLSDHSLLLAYVQELPRVTHEIVDEALSDLKQLPLHWNESVPASTPLDTPEETNEEDLEASSLEADEDELPMESDIADESFANGVSFEIGGEEPMKATETPPSRIATFDDTLETATPMNSELRPFVSHPRLQGVVPLPGITANAVRMFEEEIVEDRYAALDASAPRILRTFEDAVVPAGWQTPARPEIPAAPKAPTMDLPAVPSVSPDRTIDDMLPLIDRVMDNDESDVIAIADDSDIFLAEPDLDAEPRLAASFREEQDELEDEIGSNVLDVCLDVQNQLADWWQSTAQTASGRSADTPQDVIETEPITMQEADYDTVQPDRPVRGKEASDRSFDRLRNDSASAPRHIPKPNYRRVFSTLRRKIGRSLRREM